MRRVDVYSARMAAGRTLPDALDITRATAQAFADRGERAPGETLAPSWKILRPAKQRLRAAARDGDVDEMDLVWAWYEKAYLDEQAARNRQDPHRLEQFLAQSSITLLCVCADERRCHRRLARGILAVAGGINRGERPTGQARLFPEKDR